MHIYITYNVDSKITKIGRTSNLKRRLGELVGFKLIKSFEVDSSLASHIEQSLVICLAANYNRERREYFKIKPDIAVSYVENLLCLSMEVISKYPKDYWISGFSRITIAPYKNSPEPVYDDSEIIVSKVKFGKRTALVTHTNRFNEPIYYLIGRNFIQRFSSKFAASFDGGFLNERNHLDTLNLLKFIKNCYYQLNTYKALDFNVDSLPIKQIQYAWYSGRLKNKSEVMNYLRYCYGGLASVDGKAINMSKMLKLRTTIWDNHAENFNLEALYGGDREFTVSLYDKKDSPDQGNRNSKRLDGLIRFDCTFNYAFLRRHKIRSVADLETRYREECDKNGYDSGFFSWLQGVVLQRLKMNYLVNLTVDAYKDMMDKGESLERKTLIKLFSFWKNGGEMEKACEELNIKESNMASYKDDIYNFTGIDIEIPQEYHTNMIVNRIISHMSSEEREDFIRMDSSNYFLDRNTLIERDTNKMAEIFGNSDFSLVGNRRKLRPEKRRFDSLYLDDLFKSLEAVGNR